MATRTIPTRRYDHAYDPVYTAADSSRYPSGARSDAAAITAGNRYKYFRRPIVPFLHSVPPEVLLAPTTEDNPLQPAEEQVEAPTKTVGVQTKYRDSQAQTDPYTPDYTVRPGEEPEILTLASLSHGKGLPAGLAEVEMIERARQKREFEAALPPITDEASFELRKKMMEDQELREWAHRENEIDKLQEERLALLHAAIHERDQENEFLSEQRVEALRQRKLEEKDQSIASIQQRRIKALRKLTKQRKTVTPTLDSPHRDIIGEYASYGSRVYAPVTREGQHPDKGADRFEIRKTDIIKTLPGLNFLESTLPARMTRTITTKPRKKAAKTAKERKEQIVAGHLQRMDDMIKTQKLASTGQLAKPTPLLPSWRRRAEKTERPPTPRVAAESEEEERQELAIILLQKLLRGRAAQNMMFEGKERRAELIAELRESEALLPTEQAMEQEDAVNQQAERGIQVLEGAMDTLQGEVVSATLDFLAKELIRKKEAARVSLLADEAQKTRVEREAEEGGRRQAEENLRSRQDQLFQQVMQVHQGTADSFTDELLSERTDSVAYEQAISEIMQNEEAMAPVVAMKDQSQGENDSTVRDLVASFLLPEVERHRVRQRVQSAERRFVDAAHKSIDDVVPVVSDA